jgi:hypothetical protein
MVGSGVWITEEILPADIAEEAEEAIFDETAG